MVNKTELKGHPQEAKGRVKEALTDDELDQTEGNWDQVGTIRQKTGQSIESVEETLNGTFDSLSN